jgi:outer membrane receptor protein involved in Fe transport
LWTGDYYADERGYDQRWHASQSIAWEKRIGGLTHRFKAGGEFDYLNSSLELDRRGFQLLDDAGNLQSSVIFVGPDFTALSNQEYGAFAQDRIVFGLELQVETGIRYDRDRIADRNNLAPRFGFSYLPRASPNPKSAAAPASFTTTLGS